LAANLSDYLILTCATLTRWDTNCGRRLWPVQMGAVNGEYGYGDAMKWVGHVAYYSHWPGFAIAISTPLIMIIIMPHRFHWDFWPMAPDETGRKMGIRSCVWTGAVHRPPLPLPLPFPFPSARFPFPLVSNRKSISAHKNPRGGWRRARGGDGWDSTSSPFWWHERRPSTLNIL